jgi:hypothetical protein
MEIMEFTADKVDLVDFLRQIFKGFLYLLNLCNLL